MSYPSFRKIVCKLYCKHWPRSPSSMVSGDPPGSRRSLVDEFIRPSETVILHVCRRQIDLDQHRCGAYSRFCKQDRGDRVSLEIGVAILHQPGRDASDLVPDLG